MFWLWSVLTVVLVAALARAFLFAPFAYRLREWRVTLPFPGPKELTLLHITDLHLVPHHRRLVNFLRSLRKVDADLVLYTGDFLDTHRDGDLLREALVGISGRCGSFAVFGNHDYYRYQWSDILGHIFHDRHAPERFRDVSEIRATLEEMGIRCLVNGSCVVECGGFPLRIVGLDDPFFDRADLDAAFAGVGENETAIVLVHTPSLYRELAERGVALVLSGHAHGGQVRIPLLGPLVTRCPIPRRLALGVTRLGKTTLFASPGLGTGARLVVRFLCPPEATLLHVAFQTEDRADAKTNEAG